VSTPHATGPALLVLHDIGGDDAGDVWRTAFEDAGWAGRIVAPDLAGHGHTPAPSDGAYELVDPIWCAVRELHRAELNAPPVIVGVGVSGWSAMVLALGGRAGALVLVDAFGGQWRTPRQWALDERARLRAIADDPEAVGPAPSGAVDPRTRHGVIPISSREVMDRNAAALRVPVLFLRSPATAGDPAVDEIVAAIGAPAAIEDLPDGAPDRVAAAVVRWVESTQPGTGDRRAG